MTDSTSEIRKKLNFKVLKSRILLLNKFYKHKIQLISVDSTQNSLPIYFDAITTRFYLLVLSYKYYLEDVSMHQQIQTREKIGKIITTLFLWIYFMDKKINQIKLRPSAAGQNRKRNHIRLRFPRAMRLFIYKFLKLNT